MSRRLGAFLVLVLLLGACWGGDDDDAAPEDGAGAVRETGAFGIRLTAGMAPEATAAGVEVVDGEPLGEEAIADIVDRLPDFEGEDGDRQEFNRPPDPLPRPRVGRTIDSTFGAGGENDPPAPAVDDGPLQVLRSQPDGDVDVAPFIAVTFDQPMVPVGTLEQLDQAEVPVTVTPDIDGRWRWLGTRTLRLDPSSDAGEDAPLDRLPAATEYTVEIPAGTESATGNALGDTHRFTFSTPAPTVRQFVPGGDVIDVRPVFVTVFDQIVDGDAVLDHLTVRADGKEQSVHPASAEEIEADDDARAAVESAIDGRWVAFTPDEPLPGDAAIEVEFGAGTPSAEGPRTTPEPQVQKTRTRAPLAVVDTRCGFSCRAGDAFVIEFNNPLDPSTFSTSDIAIEPPVSASIGRFGNTISIQAETRARNTYEVTVPAEVGDAFGQTLGSDEAVTFDVDDARPRLEQFRGALVTADPHAERPGVSITSSGHPELRVTLYEVTPADFVDYLSFTRNRDHDKPLAGLPQWQQVASETLEVPGEGQNLTETTIDLGEAIAPATADAPPTGHVVVTVESTRTFARDTEAYYENLPTIAWVQATDLGVDAVADDDSLVAWTTSLRDGAPLDDVEVRLANGDAATTDTDGLATIGLTGESDFLVASAGGDSAILGGFDGGRWAPRPIGDEARWYVVDDRQLYRPGETVNVKGWVRRLALSRDARIEPVGGGATVGYAVRDGFGNEVAADVVELTGTGGFDFAVDLPAGAALGPAWIEFRVEGAEALGGAQYEHRFQIQEFRRPEFEVVTEAQSPEPHITTSPLTISALARYFAGGVLPDAPVTWQVAHQPTVYSPPNRSDYSFGVQRPVYLDHGFGTGEFFGGDFGRPTPSFGFEEECCPPFEDPDLEENTYRSRTDATGTDHLRLDFEGDTPDEPITVSANAAVEDVNRQSFGSTVDLLVHPASLYVGLRSPRTFVRQDEPLDIEAIVTDIDGDAVAGRSLTVTAARVTEEFVDGEWTEVDVDEQDCEIESGDDEREPATCSFDTEVGGRYRITGIVTDDHGGRNRTEITRWVSGAEAIPGRDVEEETAIVVPAQEEYEPGDTAEVLVVSPFSPANATVTIIRNGIAETREFAIEDGTAVVEIPVTEAMVPGIDVRVDVAGAAERLRDDGSSDPDLPPRAAYATGGVSLPVRPTTKALDVTATPADERIEPGGSTTVEVAVADAAGAPVSGAEVAVIVVDESVLSLVGYELPDPLETFYGPLFPNVRADRSRATLQLQDPEQLTGDPAAPVTTVVAELLAPDASGGATAGGGDLSGEQSYTSDDSGDGASRSAAGSGDAAAPGGGETPIDVRADFDALALFEPAVPTGADGTATVEVTVPDNLTRYRVMAVVADAGDRFGSGESTITARLPLQVRPSAPRFVNFGDEFELPVVVQNQGDDDLTAAVVLETANLTIDGPPGVAVDVPAGERVEVRFPIDVEDAGTARFRVTGVSGDLSDSATGSLPAYTPVTTEAFATYGVIDDGAVLQPLLAPEGVVPQFGGLDFDTSSTAVQALTDAVVYLNDYEHASADAFATRITALVSLRDVFSAFDTGTAPDPEELDATISSDIESLQSLQGDDGGFGTWQRGRPSQPFVSVQALHALVAAEAAGFPVSGDAKNRALEYARTIENRFPSEWDEASRHATSAFALSVRTLAGDRDPAKAENLYRSDDGLALDALAWLWPVVDDPEIDAQIVDTFEDRVAETPSAATFTSEFDESAAALVLASDRRTDGIVLDALIQRRPDSDLVPKVVTGLLGNQVKGRWNNIQENGFILLAMQRYFSTFEDVDPSFVARAWLGDTFAAEHAHQGRSIDTTHTLVPMTELVDGGAGDIVVAKEGPGRLYYRLGLRYAPDDLRQDPRDEGFVVTRSYEAVDDPDDVRRNDDGTWRIRPGATVRVRLTMVADSPRTNMALVDSLPAGFEAVNPALAASPRTTPEEDEGGDDAAIGRFTWDWTWFDHQEFRDDRASAYGSYLPAGTYDHTYVARATTPGTFVAPPTKAEEIYAPEVFGRSGSDTVVVAP